MHKIILFQEDMLAALLAGPARNLDDIINAVRGNEHYFLAKAPELYGTFLHSTNDREKVKLLVLLVFIEIIYGPGHAPELSHTIERTFKTLIESTPLDGPGKQLIVAFFTFINPTDQYDSLYGTDLLSGVMVFLKRAFARDAGN